MPAQQTALGRSGGVEGGCGQRTRHRILPRHPVVVRLELDEPGARRREKPRMAGDKGLVPEKRRSCGRAREHDGRCRRRHGGQQLIIHGIGLLEKSEIRHHARGAGLVEGEKQLRENPAGKRPARALFAHRRHGLFIHQHQGRIPRQRRSPEWMPAGVVEKSPVQRGAERRKVKPRNQRRNRQQPAPANRRGFVGR